MARKPASSQHDNTNLTEEVIVSTETETVETPIEDVVTEAPEATTEVVVEETPIDLSAFEAAVSDSLAKSDEATGEVPLADVATVSEAYRALPDAKSKAAARKTIEDAIKSSMKEGNSEGFLKARALLALQEGLTKAAPKAPRAPKAPVDPTADFVNLVSGLVLASGLAQQTVPDGVSETWAETVNANVSSQETAQAAADFKAWIESNADDKGDAPEVPEFVKAAVLLAAGRSAKVGRKARSGGTKSTFTGERRDVGKHIESAFADLEEGAFLAIAEIKNHKSAEYGDDSPSQGAIQARLFPKSGKVTVPGIAAAEQGGKKGAVKA